MSRRCRGCPLTFGDCGDQSCDYPKCDAGVIEQLEADIQEMVKKAANNNLDGYRKMGQKIAEQESTIEQLEAALKVCQQLILEVSHAQRNGSDWYTRADVGLYQQVSMWIGKAQTAINDTTMEKDDG